MLLRTCGAHTELISTGPRSNKFTDFNPAKTAFTVKLNFLTDTAGYRQSTSFPNRSVMLRCSWTNIGGSQ
jgi:hypothetical protein